jgi:hypothetical protein
MKNFAGIVALLFLFTGCSARGARFQDTQFAVQQAPAGTTQRHGGVQRADSGVNHDRGKLPRGFRIALAIPTAISSWRELM